MIQDQLYVIGNSGRGYPKLGSDLLVCVAGKAVQIEDLAADGTQLSNRAVNMIQLVLRDDISLRRQGVDIGPEQALMFSPQPGPARLGSEIVRRQIRRHGEQIGTWIADGRGRRDTLVCLQPGFLSQVLRRFRTLQTQYQIAPQRVEILIVGLEQDIRPATTGP